MFDLLSHFIEFIFRTTGYTIPLNEHNFTSLIIAILSQDSHLTYISV